MTAHGATGVFVFDLLQELHNIGVVFSVFHVTIMQPRALLERGIGC